MANPIDGSSSHPLNNSPEQKESIGAEKRVLGKRAKSIKVEKVLPKIESSIETPKKKARIPSHITEHDTAVKRFFFEGFDTDGTLTEADYDAFISIDDNAAIGQALAILYGSIQHHAHSNDSDDPTSTISLLSEALDKCLEDSGIVWSDEIDVQQDDNGIDLSAAIKSIADAMIQCVKENHGNSPQHLKSQMDKVITEGLDDILSAYIELHFEHGLIQPHLTSDYGVNS